MKRLKWIGIAVSVVIVLVIALLAGALIWLRTAMGPSETAMKALQSDDQVMVSQEADFIVFEPKNNAAATGFIFYPGAGVDARSYAPVLREIAARGHFAVLSAMPLDLAFLKPNAADQVIAKYPEIEDWIIGGHSLGGVVAASYAARQPAIDGMVFMASYPANDVLKGSDLPTLSIYGSQDGLTTPQNIEDSRALLPADTDFVEIKGGNHSQFGSYGLQHGDNQATIPPEKQWSQIVDATVAFLETDSE